MLRITHAQTETGQKWTLCGRLTGVWVDELRACWEHGRRSLAGARAGTEALEVVDVSDVTSIDESGEKLLSDMKSSGAKLMGSGVYNEHLLKNLRGKTTKCK